MLASEVLVLNRLYLPVRVTNARRAFCLMYQGKARAILPDYTTHDFASWLAHGDLSEGSIGLLFRRVAVPWVVVLRSHSGAPRHEVRFSRRNVFQRDGQRCQYCGVERVAKELNLDHVIPLSRGGLSTWENVVCCCVGCNRRKADRTPEAAGMKLLRVPQRPRWHPLHEAVRKTGYPRAWTNFVDPAILAWRPSAEAELLEATDAATQLRP